MSHVSLSFLLQNGDSTESSDVGPAKREYNPDANLPGPVLQPGLIRDDGLQQFLLCLVYTATTQLQTLSFPLMFIWFQTAKRDACRAFLQTVVYWNDPCC